MAVKRVCVLGLGKSGVPLSATIAVKCPEIRVTVVQSNPNDAFQWNTGQIPSSIFVPGLDDLIRKCQNKNLFFTTNDKDSINEANIIFILSNSKYKTYGDGKKQVVDLSMVEEAAYLIANLAESNKIVVENSMVPLKTAECISHILKHNSKIGVTFEVLSSPEFYEQGSPLQNLLHPDYVLIGSNQTASGRAAAKLLFQIYERWVPSEKIIVMSHWTVELSKIASLAILAQEMSGIQALCSICEKFGGDITPTIQSLSKKESSGDVRFYFNTGKFPFILNNLVYLCELYNLQEQADYWRQVLEMFEYHRQRFFSNFIYVMKQTVAEKQITLLGFAYHKNTEITDGSSAVYYCKALLQENAVVNIYDPRVTKDIVLEDMIASKCEIPTEKMQKQIRVFSDPYRAMCKSQVIVVCGIWPEFNLLDFNQIYSEMEKPAYFFDNGLDLPHTELMKIGFTVYSVGKAIKNVV